MKNKIPNWREGSSFKRIFHILCLLFISCNLFSQITVEVKDKQIKDVLKEIEKTSSFKFFYNEDLKGLDKTISFKISDADIDTAMDQLLKNSELSFQKQDGNIILLTPSKSKDIAANQQTKKITGVIKDAKGETIIGASVSVKGAKTGTVSDIDGLFSLDVSEGAILVISYIGFAPQEVKVGNRTNLEIILQEDTKLLDEVVVVGYGVQRKRDVTTSIHKCPNN